MTQAPRASWTILEIIRWTADYFRDKGVSEPRASAEVLLAHTLGLSRLDLYLRHDQPLTSEELARFKTLVRRRRTGEPVAYLTGHKEFWSLTFRVTPAVLIPRPETEILVAAAVEVMKEFGGAGQGLFRNFRNFRNFRKGTPAPSPKSIWGLEVGVGSGAVVVALARELPRMQWVALDVSGAPLAVARDNARRHEVAQRIYFLQTDLLTGLKPQARFALLVANLPYVPQAEWEQLPREIKEFEPQTALQGGEDGLALIGPLVRQAHHYVLPGGRLALEVGAGQARQVAELLKETDAYDHVEGIRDYQGIERVVRARRRDAS